MESSAHNLSGTANSITNEPWWQLLTIITTAVVTALATQAFVYYFSSKRKRRDEIVRLCSSLQASAQSLAVSLQFFIEFDTDFIEQQANLKNAAARGDDKAIDLHEKAAFNSQERALHYRGRYISSREGFTTALYTLTAIHSKRFENEKAFHKATAKIRDIAIDNRQNFEKAKEEIRAKLEPNLKKIEKVCHQVIYEQNASIWMKLGERLGAKK